MTRNNSKKTGVTKVRLRTSMSCWETSSSRIYLTLSCWEAGTGSALISVNIKCRYLWRTKIQCTLRRTGRAQKLARLRKMRLRKYCRNGHPAGSDRVCSTDSFRAKIGRFSSLLSRHPKLKLCYEAECLPHTTHSRIYWIAGRIGSLQSSLRQMRTVGTGKSRPTRKIETSAPLPHSTDFIALCGCLFDYEKFP